MQADVRSQQVFQDRRDAGMAGECPEKLEVLVRRLDATDPGRGRRVQILQVVDVGVLCDLGRARDDLVDLGPQRAHLAGI
jgi:hypothetical protein